MPEQSSILDWYALFLPSFPGGFSMRGAIGRRLSRLFVAIATVALATQPVAAQARVAPGNFHVGYTDIGPVIGLGNIGGALAIGGRFEHAIQALPDLANGTLGIEVGVDWYSRSPTYASGTYDLSDFAFGVTANYHFKLDEPKFDPFLGLGLGYHNYSCSYPSSFPPGYRCGYDSGIYLIGRAGARYFFSPKMAFYGDVGAGVASLNLGLMFKMH